MSGISCVLMALSTTGRLTTQEMGSKEQLGDSSRSECLGMSGGSTPVQS
jgi:hypothetical protein